MFTVEEPEIFYAKKDNFPLKNETYKIIGLAMEVHKTLGKGFLEIVYKDALELEFQWANVPYTREFWRGFINIQKSNFNFIIKSV